jgi:hypothetical protein
MMITETLKADGYFHIYNHEKGKENIFYSDDNYMHFLSLFFEYISPIANVYSYCLLPHQFQLLIKIKPEKVVFTYFKLEGKFPDETASLEDIKNLSNANGLNNLDVLGIHISKQVSNFFNAYAKIINKQQNTLNALPTKGTKQYTITFKREELKDNAQLKECISYIHSNAIKHHLAKDITSWRYNSYNAMLSDKPTKLKRLEVIDIFESVEYFIKFHEEKIKQHLDCGAIPQ